MFRKIGNMTLALYLITHPSAVHSTYQA